MACCPQRTIQNIDKEKQKNAGIRRYNPVSGRVTSQCCITCNLPTAGNITLTDLGPTGDPTFDTLYSYTVDQTYGTSFTWWQIIGEQTGIISDTSLISGSQTSTLLVKTQTIGCPGIIHPPNYLFCDVSNNCGTTRSEIRVIVGCGPL